jgi:hypothetical protein
VYASNVARWKKTCHDLSSIHGDAGIHSWVG